MINALHLLWIVPLTAGVVKVRSPPQLSGKGNYIITHPQVDDPEAEMERLKKQKETEVDLYGDFGEKNNNKKVRNKYETYYKKRKVSECNC